MRTCYICVSDSAYISHEHRQNIILLCERAKLELGHLLLKQNAVANASGSVLDDQVKMPGSPPPPPSSLSLAEVEASMRNLMKTTTELRLELQQTSLELAGSLIQVSIMYTRPGEIPKIFENSPLNPLNG